METRSYTTAEATGGMPVIGSGQAHEAKRHPRPPESGPLGPGARLGPYEVRAFIAEGAMGAVFRGRDTTLDREVALKILPRDFAVDPERVARFQREARVLAALNHPNIAQIHGLEVAGEAMALVLELVDGPTLADRIAGGAMPLEETLSIARQIAEALDAAHEQGIVHRDLKPANIKVRADGTVKVLDFGLAKALDSPGARDEAAAESPTVTATTQLGMVLGTAGYMSPEQARGEAVDQRADIWAFGCVLFEMLTGEKAFEAASASETLARILEREPDLARLPSRTPAAVAHLVRWCLQKAPRLRLRDAGDARHELDEALAELADPPNPPTPPRRGIAGGGRTVAAAGIFVAGLAVWAALTPSGPERQPTSRWVVSLPPDRRLPGPNPQTLAVSDDGSNVVFTAVDPDGTSHLYVHVLGQFSPVAIPGTEGGGHPFFSPDGTYVGFFADGQLQKVPVTGGAPTTICHTLFSNPTAAWGLDDTIVFSPTLSSGLRSVSASGGSPQLLTTPDPGSGHWLPQILPDDKGVLFTALTGQGRRPALLSLATGEWRMLDGIGPRAGAARYVSTGHLVFAHAGGLYAVPFDLDSLDVTGRAVSVLTDVQIVPGGGLPFAVSRTGTLVYVPSAGGTAGSSLVWVDREGRSSSLAHSPGQHSFPRLSPDGRRIAFGLVEEENLADLWVLDVERGTRMRLTTGVGSNRFPVWSPDGRRLAFSSTRSGPGVANLFWTAADASGPVEVLLLRERAQVPTSWSREGGLLFYDLGTAGQRDIWVLRSSTKGDVTPVAATSFNERAARFSPDGRFLAFVSDASGTDEVYLERYPNASDRWTVSTDGGREPAWSPSGRELFYRDGTTIMVVELTAGPKGVPSAPRPLFSGPYAPAPFVGNANYDVAADGRFVMVLQDDAGARPQLHVVLNWLDELTEQVPTSR